MSQLSLLKSKKFFPLFWTQFCAALNDNFLKNALIILVTFKTASVLGIPPNQIVAAAGGIFILPFFLFSATAGQLADKFEKTRIIKIIKFAEIVIMGFAAYGLLAERFGFLLLVLFLMGLHSTFFGPIKYSILPQHLTNDKLVGANALIEAGTFLAILLGTITGGALISIEKSGPLIVSIGLLSVAVIGFSICFSIPKAPAVAPGLKIQYNVFAQTWRIFQNTRKNKPVFLSILGISWFWFFGATILSIIPPYCKDVLHADSSVITLFIASFSVGIGIGSLLCERLSRGSLELGLVPLGSIGISLFAFDLFLIGSPDFYLDSVTIRQFLSEFTGVRIMFDFLMISIFSGLFTVPLYTLIQERSDPSQRSRIIAGNNIINAFFMVVAALLLMILLRLHFSFAEVFLTLSLLNGAVAIYIYTLLPEFLIRFIVWSVAHLMYRLKVINAVELPKKGPAIIISNHVSFVDWMIIGASVKRPVRFIMDHHFARGFLAKKLLKNAKVILIASQKENPALLQKAFEKASEELRKGEIICLFPEGKITSDGKIDFFRPGVERLIREFPVVVIPMAIRGMWGSIFSRESGKALSHFPRNFWSRVELVVGAKIQPDDATLHQLRKTVVDLYQGYDDKSPPKLHT